MILNDASLLYHGLRLIEPFDPAHVQPASIDVHLGPHLKVEWSSNVGPVVVDPAKDNESAFYSHAMTPQVPYVDLEEGDLALGSTFEKITVPKNMAARFEGKSSLGRLGLITHVTAGFIDPGFSGEITVEMTKIGRKPLRLHAGMKIGQICFYYLAGDAENPYGSEAAGSHYQGQTGPQISRSHERFKTIDVWGQ